MCEAILELFADEYEQKSKVLIAKVTEEVTEQVTEQGVVALVETCMELGMSKEQALAKAAEKFHVSPEDVHAYTAAIV